jgi:hypothetical protein
MPWFPSSILVRSTRIEDAWMAMHWSDAWDAMRGTATTAAAAHIDGRREDEDGDA